MSSTSEKNKRIAINTIVLYVRMLLLMFIALYTSRVTLDALGVEDYGIYNVVGGFVSAFAIISSALSGACSRFLNYEMGRGRMDRLANVFSTAINIHSLLSLLVVLVAETVGLWFLNEKMVIPDNRFFAANWVFQLSLFTFCINLFVVPYRSALIAHERMKAFAYVSVIEGFLKFILAFLIAISPIDRLIFYAGVLCTIQVGIGLVYMIYCKRNFQECTYHWICDKSMTKEILSYSGWNFLGHASGILRNQGGNILINIFFGPAVNAARGIANQVLAAVEGFVSNYMLAVNPQISQSYGAGELDYMRKLVYTSARFSFFLIYILSLPIILNIDFILSIWLKEVPNHSAAFVQLMLIFSMIQSINMPIQYAQAATGRIRNYQLVVATSQLMILPVTYILFKVEFDAEALFYVSIIINSISVYLRVYMLSRIIEWDILKYSKEVIFKVLGIVFVSLPFPLFVKHHFEQNLMGFLVISSISIICTISTIWFIGLSCNEKNMIKDKLFFLLNKIRK